MAVVFEGFSIREYASKMRSMDVVKCWPFSGGDDDDDEGNGNGESSSKMVSRETMESLLPPMTVTKFRWWADELDLLKSTTEHQQAAAANLDVRTGSSRSRSLSSSSVENNSKLRETKPRNLKSISSSSNSSSSSDLLLMQVEVEEVEEEEADERIFDTSMLLECPVCGAFSASTVNALNAHVDGCLASKQHRRRRHMRRRLAAVVKSTSSKSRTPKKRSIMEIFAAAPQIHEVAAVDDDDDDGSLQLDEAEDEVEDHENEDGSLNCKIERLKDKTTKKKKRKKMAIVKKLMMKKKKNNQLTINNNKKKKKNENKKKDGPIANKENGSKPKLQTPVNFNRKPNTTVCKRDSSGVSVLRKKPSLKCLSAKKKNKIVQASKPIVEHETPISPVRGILKSPKRPVSGQNAAMCNVRTTTQSTTCGIQHLVRHVSFSGKDDILGPHKKPVTSCEKSICHGDLDSLELSKRGHWIEDNREPPAIEINGSDDEDVSFSTENGIGVHDMMDKQQLPDVHHNVDTANFHRPHIVEQEKARANHFSDKSLPPGQAVLDSGNLHILNQGNQTAFGIPLYNGVPRVFSALKEIQNPFVNAQASGSVAATSNYSSLFVDYFEDRTKEIATISSKDPRASLQPPSSGFALGKSADEGVPLSSYFVSEDVPGHALAHQPLYHLSPIEMMGRLCPFPEWKQKAVALREKYKDDGFFGLPLNSQGELVQGNSSGKGGFNQLKTSAPASGSSNSINNLVLSRRMDDHSIMKGKHFIENALPNDQLSLFPAQNHMKENAALHSPAKLRATESQGPRKEDGYLLNSDSRCNHSVCSTDSELNLTNFTFSGCRQYDQFQIQKEKGISHTKENSDKMLPNSPPPTMRLMGKDVTICQSSNERQGFADGKVWTDKEIIREHHPQSTALQNSYVDRHCPEDWPSNPASGMFKETPAQRFEMEHDQVFPSNVLTKPPEFNFFQPGLNWQPNSEFHNSSLTVARNPYPNSHHFAHPPTSHTVFHKGANFQEPFIPRNETLGLNSQLSSASTSQRFCQNRNGSSVELNYKHDLPNVVKSSFNFPFLHPDHGEHVQPTWFRGSSKSLIPWLLQATQHVKPPSIPSQPFPEAGDQWHLHTSRTSFSGSPLAPHPPIVSYDHNPVIAHSHVEGPVGQSSVAHSPLIPASHGIRPTSANMSHGNRMKSKSTGVQDANICQKTRKRPGAKEDYPMKPVKMPNLGIQHESRAATRLTSEAPIDDIHCNTGSLAIDPYRDEVGHLGWIPNEFQFNALETPAGIDSSKVDSQTRAGPIKLSAGAKHILKPSPNLDQDNSRMIHSTIPFASLTDRGSILESQKKSTKVYRF